MTHEDAKGDAAAAGLSSATTRVGAALPAILAETLAAGPSARRGPSGAPDRLAIGALGHEVLMQFLIEAVVLAAIGERTSRIKLSTGVILGANLDPVRVAEDYATIDLLSDGRVEPVIGRGTFFPHTFASFGQDPATAKEVFMASMNSLKGLTSSSVNWLP